MKSQILKKVKQHQNVLTIKSVVPLTEEEKEQIVSLFNKKTEAKIDRVVTLLDPRLICGVSAKSDSFGFEYSGRKIINEMIRDIDL